MRQLIASALYHVRGSTPILCHTASCIATLELGLHSRATLYVGQQAQQQQHFSQRLYTSASSSSAGLWQQQPHCLWPRTTASSAYALQQCQHLLSAQQQQLQWPCSLQQQQCRQYATSEAAKRRLVAAHERRQREKELAERRSSAATPTVVEPGSSAVATPQEPDGQHVTALAPQESPPSQVQIADVVNHPALIVTRAIEWGTVILGFEQATKYTVYDQDGSVVALIAEEISGIGNELQRQLLRTRRSFRSTVLSADGTQVLFRVRRPAYLINSHMYIEDPQGEVVGEVRQRWHLWRRNYDLYINRRQFAAINGGFLAWEFELKDREGNTLALVDRNFLGFAKEIFTDAGKYVVHFGYSPQTAADMTSRTLQIRSGQSDVAVTPVAQARTDVAVIPTVTGNQLVVHRSLDLSERLVALAAAISVDYNFFSPHSAGGGFFGPPIFMPVPLPGGGAPDGGAAAEGTAGAGAASGATNAAGAETASAAAGASAQAAPDNTGFNGDAGFAGDNSGFSSDNGSFGSQGSAPSGFGDDSESFKWDLGSDSGGSGGGDEDSASGLWSVLLGIWAMVFGE